LQTWQPILGQEFVVIHDLLNRNLLSAGRRGEGAHDVFWKKYGILAMMSFPFHMIAWVDDSLQLVPAHHIWENNSFPNAKETDWIGPKMWMINEVHHGKLCWGPSILYIAFVLTRLVAENEFDFKSNGNEFSILFAWATT
jgi:hypothetical protein